MRSPDSIPSIWRRCEALGDRESTKLKASSEAPLSRDVRRVFSLFLLSVVIVLFEQTTSPIRALAV